MHKIKVGIVGATGYVGMELMRLLFSHPQVSLEIVTSKHAAGQRLDALYPALRGHTSLRFVAPDDPSLKSCDLVFFATPNGTAMFQATELLNEGIRIIDLAADFRLTDSKIWSEWYGMDHVCPDLLGSAVYGLPELNRERIRSANLVANPGCYPTAITLGLLPLLKSDFKWDGAIIADAKSGVSGAGRKAAIGTLYAETGENFHPYAVDGHRHWPEIHQTIQQVIGKSFEFVFVPHLLPMIRGIEASIYVHVQAEIEDLRRYYLDFYQNEHFVDVLDAGFWPETKTVRGANDCRISLARPRGTQMTVVMSVIDNLVKGAAGQAIQNMNLMFNIAETTGLETVALQP